MRREAVLDRPIDDAPFINPPPFPNIDELPYEDGIPMETPYHRMQMNLLIDLTDYHWRAREDYYVGGNMFIYFSQQQIRNRDYRGPDFFIVTEVDRKKERKAWIVWEEDGRYPDLIIELLSESTADLDKTVKKRLYERTFHTPEYLCYEIETGELLGWQLGSARRYEPMQRNGRGQLWSNVLQLWLGPEAGEFQRQTAKWLRFFDDNGERVPTLAEAESSRATAEAARAAQLEAELVQLRTLLAEREN